MEAHKASLLVLSEYSRELAKNKIDSDKIELYHRAYPAKAWEYLANTHGFTLQSYREGKNDYTEEERSYSKTVKSQKIKIQAKAIGKLSYEQAEILQGQARERQAKKRSFVKQKQFDFARLLLALKNSRDGVDILARFKGNQRLCRRYLKRFYSFFEDKNRVFLPWQSSAQTSRANLWQGLLGSMELTNEGGLAELTDEQIHAGYSHLLETGREKLRAVSGFDLGSYQADATPGRVLCGFLRSVGLRVNRGSTREQRAQGSLYVDTELINLYCCLRDQESTAPLTQTIYEQAKGLVASYLSTRQLLLNKKLDTGHAKAKRTAIEAYIHGLGWERESMTG